jgi:glycosyltransferase involved in cell wall biosynthesis
MNRRGVLVLGSAQYSDRSWVNCQEVASRLAGGHDVLFVDSVGLRSPRPHGADLSRIARRLRDWVRGVRRAPDGVRVLSPIARSGSLLGASIRWGLRTAGIEPAAVIAYLPTWAPIVEAFPRARRIYHCVDAYAENPGVDRARIESLELRLVQAVDTVLAVSEPLARRLSAIHPDVRHTPNVADVERFAAGGPEPADMSAIPRPRLLYLGNIAAYKIDLSLLEAIARARPAWSLVLVGPIGRGDPSTDPGTLRQLPNVHLLGERDRGAAPGYVAAADVCLLPLRGGASTSASSPLKTWEYLASGKPVVAAPIPALREWIDSGLIRGGVALAEWITAVEASLAEGDAVSASRRTEASRHGWAARIREIEALIADTLPPEARPR